MSRYRETLSALEARPRRRLKLDLSYANAALLYRRLQTLTDDAVTFENYADDVFALLRIIEKQVKEAQP